MAVRWNADAEDEGFDDDADEDPDINFIDKSGCC